MYAITGLCHRRDISMSGHGFIIDLAPQFKDAVSRSGVRQEQIDAMLQTCGRYWLDCAGFDDIYDPDNSGFHRDPKKKPGPNAYPLYRPGMDLRVTWGEWGPEHITVPGNACGLDISRSAFGSVFDGGVRLTPHNVDSLAQKYLLLIVFTEIAHTVQLFAENPVESAT